MWTRVLASLVLLGTAVDGAEVECRRLGKTDLKEWWVPIDEVIRGEARKPWGQQRPGAGLRCLAALEAARADEVFVDLLEHGAPQTKRRTSWYLAVERSGRPGEEVVQALVKLTRGTGPEQSITDHDLQGAAHWAWKLLVASADSSPAAASFVLAHLKDAIYCFNSEAYEAAKRIDTPEARAILRDLQKRIEKSDLHDCDLDLIEDATDRSSLDPGASYRERGLDASPTLGTRARVDNPRAPGVALGVSWPWGGRRPGSS